MTYIITHTSPDWDAIGGCWFLQRFGGLGDATVRFVNTGAPDQDILDGATAVVDTGREYDPARRRFDHHHLPGSQANDTSATLQVFAYLAGDNPALDYLKPIAALIWSGDTGRISNYADASRAIGIHALLSAQKAKRLTDEQLLSWGYNILDDLAAHLKAQADARAALDSCVVWQSKDGLVVALEQAPPMATQAAHEAGARLVVFHSDMPDVPSVAVGVMRGGEAHEPHIGHLIAVICDDWECGLDVCSEAVYQEIARWYRHEAGFFAGRGTRKAPVNESLMCSVADIATAIDRAWRR